MGMATKSGETADVATIGLDLAKNVFQAHGANVSGEVIFRKRLRRGQVLTFFAAQPRCMVAMEACTSAHHRARAIGEPGHDVRLIAPAYVKPFVKRQKNDAADAEAIAEAATRPTMRFVPVKSEAKQASAVIFRTRDLPVRQRTQIINALRGHMGEHGLIAPQGRAHVGRLMALIDDPASDVPDAARACPARLVAVLPACRSDAPKVGLVMPDLRRDAAADRAIMALITTFANSIARSECAPGRTRRRAD